MKIILDGLLEHLKTFVFLIIEIQVHNQSALSTQMYQNIEIIKKNVSNLNCYLMKCNVFIKLIMKEILFPVNKNNEKKNRHNLTFI